MQLLTLAATSTRSKLRRRTAQCRREPSKYKAVHTADAVRLLLIYKYGGLYLDLDYVVLRDLSHYKNMLLEEG